LTCDRRQLQCHAPATEFIPALSFDSRFPQQVRRRYSTAGLNNRLGVVTRQPVSTSGSSTKRILACLPPETDTCKKGCCCKFCCNAQGSAAADSITCSPSGYQLISTPTVYAKRIEEAVARDRHQDQWDQLQKFRRVAFERQLCGGARAHSSSHDGHGWGWRAAEMATCLACGAAWQLLTCVHALVHTMLCGLTVCARQSTVRCSCAANFSVASTSAVVSRNPPDENSLLLHSSGRTSRRKVSVLCGVPPAGLAPGENTQNSLDSPFSPGQIRGNPPSGCRTP
jgi:hypothetical protein